MKKFCLIILLLISLYSPFIVKADSGLDAKYDSASSSDLFGSISSMISPGLKLMGAGPNDENYKLIHIVVSIICIIVFYIFVNIYVFKLNNKQKKTTMLGISLIPTVLFGSFCLLTKLPIILYIIILIIYIIIIKSVTKKMIKKILQRKIDNIKEIDKKFNIENLNKETFDIYKNIQLSWMNFELNKIKELISKEMFNKYQEKLDILKKDNQKNIMDNIEFKSNKIVDIRIENNIEIIECEMNVTCFDYIIDNNEKVIKGKKDKKCNYVYKLVFNKNLNTNKYVLVEKKMLKQK